MKIIFYCYGKEIALVNITKMTTEQVKNTFDMVFGVYPDATFEYQNQ